MLLWETLSILLLKLFMMSLACARQPSRRLAETQPRVMLFFVPAHAPGQVDLRQALAQSPEVIVCDEIGGFEEAQEIKSGLNCGVRFILTAHCYDLESLVSRPQVKALLDSGEFGCVAFLQGGKLIGQPAKIVMLGNDKYEIGRPFADSTPLNSVGGISV